MENTAKLIVGAGESSADIRYATGLSTPDDFIWFSSGGASVAVLSALEFDRARKQVKPGVGLLPERELGGKSRAEKILELAARYRVAAVSVGVCDGKPTLDLDYAHDSTAEVDLNVVMTDDGRYVELQGTAEHKPFTEESLDALRALARKGLKRIFALTR